MLHKPVQCIRVINEMQIEKKTKKAFEVFRASFPTRT